MGKRHPPAMAGILKRTAPLALFLALPACADASGPAAPAEVVFTVTGTAFERDGVTGMAVVPFTVTNPTKATVWVNACGDEPAAWSDRWEDGRWLRHSTHPCSLVPSDLALAPDGAVDGAYALDVPGRYRLGLAVRAEDRGEETWLHITPPFEVR